MRIRDVMITNPVMVKEDTLILDARRLMKEKNIRRLPVVEGGKLIGIVTKQDLDQAAPSSTTPTGAYEFHYVYSKMKVKEVMKRDLVTVTPDTPVEEVLRIGQEKKVGSFLVVEDGKFVGMATESDIVRFLCRVLGLEQDGVRITIDGLGRKLGGDLEKIISILEKNRIILLSMLSLPRPDKKDWMIVLRVKTREPVAIVNDMKNAGFNATYTG